MSKPKTPTYNLKMTRPQLRTLFWMVGWTEATLKAQNKILPDACTIATLVDVQELKELVQPLEKELQ